MISNGKGIVRKRLARNAHGETTLEALGRTERFGVVRLAVKSTPTGIRAAESASRGSAREPIADILILAEPDTRVEVDDQIEIYAIKIRVTGKQPRLRAHGGLDHYELTGERWV